MQVQDIETPTVTITGGGGVGAAATVGIETYRQGVSRATIISSGDGYTDVPLVTFGSPTLYWSNRNSSCSK